MGALQQESAASAATHAAQRRALTSPTPPSCFYTHIFINAHTASTHTPHPHLAPLSGAGALQEDSAASAATRAAQQRATQQLTGLAAKTWFAGTELDAPRGPDGKYANGWHWGVMPYSIRRDLPEWYMKEVERYNY